MFTRTLLTTSQSSRDPYSTIFRETKEHLVQVEKGSGERESKERTRVILSVLPGGGGDIPLAAVSLAPPGRLD